MATTEIWTYQDAVEHLLDVFDSTRAGRPLRVAKRAVVHALRELSSLHRWSCYESVRTFKTEASYITGTIAYDHTGGDYERLVTLSDGTFPDNIRYFRLIIDDVHYPVAAALTSTTVQLSAEENPGEDVAAGTSYTAYRNAYPLPVGFMELGELWSVDDQLRIPVVTADESHRESIFWYDTPGTPWQACIRNDGEYLNSLSLVFGPPPDSIATYSISYHRAPRALLTEKYSTGTVAVSAGESTCAITTGAFTQDHVGCIIRFGTAAAEPDNCFGGLSDTTNTYAYERSIIAVATDGSECTLDSSIATAQTDVKFTVSDPIDIETGAMLAALLRMAEAEYTKLTKRDLKDRRERDDLAIQAFRLAKEKDQRAGIANRPFLYNPFERVTVSDET